MSSKYLIELLNIKQHKVIDFSCGIQELDKYIKERAHQESKKKLTAVYVIREKRKKFIVGFYTLSSYSTEQSNLPDEITKKLPKYPLLPTTLLGRFAIDKKYQGKKIGQLLLFDALFRSYSFSRELGSIAVVVEAKNKTAKGFYEKYGFKSFLKYPLKLFLPMKTIANLITA